MVATAQVGGATGSTDPGTMGSTVGGGATTFGGGGADAQTKMMGDTNLVDTMKADTMKSEGGSSPRKPKQASQEIDWKSLIKDCVSIVESFDPRKTTIDAHYETVMEKSKKDAVTKKFIQQVFYSCIRYQKFLKLFVNAFLYKNPASAPRSDQSLYMILGALFFFRIEELGFAEAGKIILKSNLSTPPALLALMDFIFTEEDLNNWVKMEWCQYYDLKYIEDQIIGKMQEIKPNLQTYLDQLRVNALGAAAAAEATDDKEAAKRGIGSTKEPTKIIPFNLTRPKPRLIPQPQPIARTIEAKPIPKTLQNTSLAKINEEKEERKKEVAAETKAKYDANRDEFFFETSKRPGADDAARARYVQDVEDLKYKECTFQPKTNALQGKYELNQAAEVRHNASSILREDFQVKKKQENEYNILMDYERGLLDASDFYMWQYKKRAQDDVEERNRIEQRKIEMHMSQDDAREAMALDFQKKRVNAENMKLQMKVLEKKKELELAAEMKEKQILCQEVIDLRGRPAAKIAEIEQKKVERAIELRTEKAVRKERREAEIEHEMEQKKDLLRQIRAIVRVSTVTADPYDASEPPRHGVLEEMSLSELRERYKIEKAIQERKRSEKRDFILDEKIEKRKDLLSKAANISRIRSLARVEAAERHAKLKQQKIEAEEVQQKLRDVAVVEVADKIKKKKQARYLEEQRLAKELKEIAAKRQFLAAGQEMVEAKQNFEQLRGLEREIKVRQSTKLEEARVGRQIRKEETKIINENRDRELEEFEKLKRGVDERLAQSKKDDAMLRDEFRVERADAHAVQRKIEAKLKVTQGQQLPYATRVNKESIERGRRFVAEKAGQTMKSE